MQPGGQSVLVAAAFDGTVLCYTPAGKLLWKIQASSAFPFDLGVGDINGDGRDETLVAAADGALYAIDHNGKLLWRFHRAPPTAAGVSDKGDGYSGPASLMPTQHPNKPGFSLHRATSQTLSSAMIAGS